MQTRRILLLFALVLGAAALVASFAPAPSERDEDETSAPVAAAPASSRVPTLRFPAPPRRPVRRRVAPDTRVKLEVDVAETGDVEVRGLGLRQTAEPRVPARFELIAPLEGAYAVVFHPVEGSPSTAGRLVVRRPGRERSAARSRPRSAREP